MLEVFKSWLVEARLGQVLTDDEIEDMLEDRCSFRDLLEEFVRICYYDIWVCNRDMLKEIRSKYPQEKPEGE